MEIESRVFLLAILKKQEDESLKDVILILEDAGVFSFKEGKKLLKELKNDGYVDGEALTFIGIEKAKDAELEFKL
ncbi:MAG TPA: hypothetical protein EYH01_08920 [Campylobacterales bacterium]|nr:hypothetical protein [Campylobacterales bacterium]